MHLFNKAHKLPCKRLSLVYTTARCLSANLARVQALANTGPLRAGPKNPPVMSVFFLQHIAPNLQNQEWEGGHDSNFNMSRKPNFQNASPISKHLASSCFQVSFVVPAFCASLPSGEGGVPPTRTTSAFAPTKIDVCEILVHIW